MEFPIDDTIQRIMVQFSVGKETRLSSWLSPEPPETKDQSNGRKLVTSGEELLPTTFKTSIASLPEGFVAAGFVLVDASLLPRRKRSAMGPTNELYYVGRFIFARERHPAAPEWEDLLDGKLSEAFAALCGQCWRARAYNNPCLDNSGEPVPGERWLSLNFEVSCDANMRLEKRNGDLVIEDGTLAFRPFVKPPKEEVV